MKYKSEWESQSNLLDVSQTNRQDRLRLLKDKMKQQNNRMCNSNDEDDEFEPN